MIEIDGLYFNNIKRRSIRDYNCKVYGAACLAIHYKTVYYFE